MYQKTTIVGNLGSNPEMRYLQSGLAVTSFSVAVNSVRKGQNGESSKDTIWFRVSVFGKPAELCNQYLSKGRQVLVEGTLKADPSTGSPRIFERRDGTVGASFDLTASHVKFIGSSATGDPSATLENAEQVGDEIPF